jgi:hypothetical protein
MDSIFTYRDEVEGKVGIGRLPIELQSFLDDIAKEYYNTIPDKNASTYHTWYDNMPQNIKLKIEKIQQHKFWNKLCDGSEKCRIISANEIDELYYSNPQNSFDTTNLYGASGNYDIHKDCNFNFNGIKFYRILIGISNGNNNITTYFNNLDIGHKLNSGDYIVFDFDKSTHQVIKEKHDESTPRILLKMHYIVCENCEYSKDYIEQVKQLYLYNQYVFRYFMKTGTDPKTFYQFFIGLICQYCNKPYTKYIILVLIILLLFVIKVVLKTKFIYKNISKILTFLILSLLFIYIQIVTFYWLRYKILGIR